jgi:hypothetical protein
MSRKSVAQRIVIPVKTGNQEYDLDPGVRRGDEV